MKAERLDHVSRSLDDGDDDVTVADDDIAFGLVKVSSSTTTKSDSLPMVMAITTFQGDFTNGRVVCFAPAGAVGGLNAVNYKQLCALRWDECQRLKEEECEEDPSNRF
jgi:hypothetical protein